MVSGFRCPTAQRLAVVVVLGCGGGNGGDLVVMVVMTMTKKKMMMTASMMIMARVPRLKASVASSNLLAPSRNEPPRLLPILRTLAWSDEDELPKEAKELVPRRCFCLACL